MMFPFSSLPFRLAASFSLAILANAQPNNGMVNSQRVTNRRVNTLNRSDFESIIDGFTRLNEIKNSLNYSSVALNSSIELLNERVNMLNDKLAESSNDFELLKHFLHSFRQLLYTTDVKLRHGAQNDDIYNGINELKNSITNLTGSIVELKEDVKQINTELKNLKEIHSVNATSLRPQTKLPDSEVTSREGINNSCSCQELYNHDNATGSYPETESTNLELSVSNVPHYEKKNISMNINKNTSTTIFDTENDIDRIIIPGSAFERFLSICNIQVELSVYVDKKLTYLESLVTCEEMDMQLVSIFCQKKQDKIKALIIEKVQEYPHLQDADFWTSGFATDEHDYSWFSSTTYDHLKMTYTNWIEGHPRLFSKPHNVSYWRGCVSLTHQYDYRWISLHCDDAVSYPICERPKM